MQVQVGAGGAYDVEHAVHLVDALFDLDVLVEQLRELLLHAFAQPELVVALLLGLLEPLRHLLDLRLSTNKHKHSTRSRTL